MLDTLWQDLRYAARTLRKNPGFTAVASVILALTIGANTTVFSVAKAILFRPLGISDPARVAWLNFSNHATGQSTDMFSWVDFTELRQTTKTFSHLALVAWPGLMWEHADRAEPVTSIVATSDLFEILRIRPVLGRTLTAADETPSAA